MSSNSSNAPWLSITASAPGKTILHGEHSVVYGKFAIAASLDLRTTVKLEKPHTECNAVTFNFTDLDFIQSYAIQDIQNDLFNTPLQLENEKISNLTWETPEIVNVEAQVKLIDNFVTKNSLETRCELANNEKASLNAILFLYTIILRAFNVKCTPIKFTTSSELQISSGLGSSASYLVASTAAFWRLCNPDVKLPINDEQKKLFSRWAFMAEKIFHGTPSGVDNTICTFGSMIGFTKGGEIKQISHPDDFKVLLINTKVPKSTIVQVGKAKRKLETFPDVMKPILDSMHSIAVTSKEYLLKMHDIKNNTSVEFKETYEKLGEIVDINQCLLKSLGVSHKSIDLICSLMSEFNLHSKLTGAGGGGYCFTLIPPDTQESKVNELKEKLEIFGFDAVLVTLGGKGVVIN